MRFFLTGGGRGIGAAIALAVARAGHDICVTWQGDEAAATATLAAIRAAAPACRAFALHMDLTDSDSVATAGDAAIGQLGGIDAVVCNAATNLIAPLPLMTDTDWGAVIDTNLSGSFRVARHFSVPFLAQKHGRYIFLSSIAATGMTGQAAYAASKAGLVGLSGTLAREFGPRRITSNLVTLGLFDAGMGQNQSTEKFRADWQAHSPARRLGQAEEAAAAVLYLASDDAGFINGQELRLTGGLDRAP